jgi:hypothetical protein
MIAKRTAVPAHLNAQTTDFVMVGGIEQTRQHNQHCGHDIHQTPPNQDQGKGGAIGPGRNAAVAEIVLGNTVTARSSSIFEGSRQFFDNFYKKAALFPHHFGLTWMRAGPLRQNEETAQYKSRDNGRGKRAAQCQATMIYRLVEQVANRRAQRPR